MPGCDHCPSSTPRQRGLAASTLGGGKGTTGHQQEGYAAVCGRCGARRVDQQLGLEALPFCATWERGPRCNQCYICRMVAVFEAVKRVLHPTGTCWIVIGDSYTSGNRIGHGTRVGSKQQTNRGMNGTHDPQRPPQPLTLKDKDLCGLPWRLALALQAAGWWLRSELIWAKLNPLPESVTDRPTKAHEQVFLLSKAPRYYFDQIAVRQPYARAYVDGPGYGGLANKAHWKQAAVTRGLGKNDAQVNAGANLRSVLSLASEPFPGAHFATMPTKLVEPCILAGSSAAGVCSACGAPHLRVVERYRTHNGVRRDDLGAWRNTDPGCPIGAQGDGHWRYATVAETTGWTASCACNAGTVPATILDPFCGSGTTMLTALTHGRASLGIDLNASYLDLAIARLTPALAQLPLFGLREGDQYAGALQQSAVSMVWR